MRIKTISGVEPKGPNVPYDFDIPNYGKYEVKQLDNDGTLNTGCHGRNALRPVKRKIDEILSRDDAPKKLAETSSDEVCEGKFPKIKIFLQKLNACKKYLYEKLSVHQMYDPVTGAYKECDSIEFYKALSITRTPDEVIEIMGLESYTIAKKLVGLSHPYIDSPEQMDIDLNNMANETFTNNDIHLIFVEEQKGYYIMKNPAPNLEFARITRGNPRFRVRFPASLRDGQKTDKARHCQSAGTSTTPTP
jgi:hypothetical protein